MFVSKIWFFLIAVVAAAGLTLALVMPRPAQRATAVAEDTTLMRACGIATVMLEQNGRQRVDLAANYAAGRDKLRIDTVLLNASKSEQISDNSHRTAKTVLSALLEAAKESGTPPDFIIAIDRRGRVVSRVGLQAGEFGDSLRGYYIVDDALAGYMRDDTWLIDNQLYRVAAAPVVAQRELIYTGAVIVGHSFDKQLAEGIGGSAGANMAFYADGQLLASSVDTPIHKGVLAQFAELGVLKPDAPVGGEQTDCTTYKPFTVTAGDKTYRVSMARLPGEARERGAFYAVFREQKSAVRFMATFNDLSRSDMAFGNFPWIPVGLGFLLSVGIGLGLMIMEGDRPLKRLAKDAVGLAKGESKRLEELKHKGKAGSIARSINIALDKLEREAKGAKRDLDSLLGPAPGGSARPASPSPMPPPVGGPLEPSFDPPPPSEFRFNDQPPAPPPVPKASPAPPPFELDLPPPPPGMTDEVPVERTAHEQVPPPPIDLPINPVAAPARKPPPLPPPTVKPAPAAVGAIDDDILGGEDNLGPSLRRPDTDFDAPTRVADPSQNLLAQSAFEAEPGGEFQQIFEEFTALKQQCGESTDALTYGKFADKLRKNRDSLIAKHGCRGVKFQVYIKDGKAALKATPVKS